MNSLLRDVRVISLMLVASLTIMSNTTIAPALPGLEALFKDTENAGLLVRLLVTAPSLTVALSAPFMGMLVDRVGRRKPLLIGTCFYALFGTAGYYLGDLHLILISRFLFGFAVSVVMTSNSALAADYFHGPNHARVMSFQVAACQFGGLLFVALAGQLAALDPTWTFLIYSLAILLLPLFIIGLPEAQTRLQPTAQPFETLHKSNWKLTATLMAGFASATMMFFYIVPTQFAYLLADLGINDPKKVGTGLSAFMLAGGISATLSGWLGRRFGPLNNAIGGLIVVTIGMLGLAVSSEFHALFASVFLIGGGMGLIIPVFMIIAFQSAPANKRGTVAGWVTAALYMGQFTSPFVSQTLIQGQGFSVTFMVFGAAMLLIAGSFKYLQTRRII